MADPLYASAERSRPPNCTGVVIAAWWASFAGVKAPFRSATGLRSARPVATAYRMIWPQFCMIRCADSIAPRS